jgi:hypothetical protein
MRAFPPVAGSRKVSTTRPGDRPALLVFGRQTGGCFMADETHDDVFRLKPKPAQSKADITDETVRALLKEEAEERAARTQKLRAARLAREAEAPTPAPVKRRKPTVPRFRKVAG